jgi:cytochrome c peroxidase
MSPFVIAACSLSMLAMAWSTPPDSLSPKELLGKLIFEDQHLSTPQGQSCAACHGAQVGFTGPKAIINATIAVYPGAVKGRFGNRKPPAAAYAGDSPVLHYDADDETWVGGMFWDGRATGERLGDPLAEQAQKPFLNPLEMNEASPQLVCETIRASLYAPLFEQVWGVGSLDCADAGIGLTYDRIAYSLAAYERSSEVSAFTSKYDRWLQGKAQLTDVEEQGRQLFEGRAQCSNCHISRATSDGKPPLFTDFTYDNLGVPKNPLNPFYYLPPEYNPDGRRWVDYGLGGYLKQAGYPASVYTPELGKMKVPTLRNVAKAPGRGFIKAFGHNGYFKSLKEIVHFYNTRDTLPLCAGYTGTPGVTCWPAPEVAATVNREELGNLGLTDREEDALVAFLGTLSDESRSGRHHHDR